MTDPEARTRGQEVVSIFQDTRQVLRSGLLYVGPGTRPRPDDSEQRELKKSIAHLEARELGNLILERSASSPSIADRRALSLLCLWYVDLQNDAAMEHLQQGTITATRREDALLDTLTRLGPGPDKDQPIMGPAVGHLYNRTHIEAGRFRVQPDGDVVSPIPMGVQVIDLSGERLVDIDIQLHSPEA